MSSGVDIAKARFDLFKLACALLVVLFALTLFYVYAEHSLLYRVIGLLTAIGVAVAIALTTAQGQQIKAYFVDARIEVSKVVWPTQKETVQTTLIVIGMVIIIALLLWVLDSLLGWLIAMLMQRGG